MSTGELIAIMDWRDVKQEDREAAIRVINREAIEIDDIGFPTIALALAKAARLLERVGESRG